MSGIVGLNHLGLLVESVDASVTELVDKFGFSLVDTSGESGTGQRALLVQGGAVLALCHPEPGSPDAALLSQHGDFVVDVGLRCVDPVAVHDQLLRRGGEAVTDGLAVRGFGDVRHSLVAEAPGRVLVPGFGEVRPDAGDLGLLDVDHLAVALPAGDLAIAVRHYRDILGFQMIFEERIAVGDQVMMSQVVQDASSTVTLTLIEPDPSASPGQIDTFLRDHGGAGIQHVAFRSPDAVVTVDEMRRRGVEFLTTVGSYYTQLVDRIHPQHHAIEELRRTQLLLDEDERGQLFQIFTKSTHPNGTLFYEIIERAGARTFGSNNVKALYEAVQAAQQGAHDVA